MLICIAATTYETCRQCDSERYSGFDLTRSIMSEEQDLTVSLPTAALDRIQEAIDAGFYNTVDDLIGDALSLLFLEHDKDALLMQSLEQDKEEWLRTVVVKAYDEALRNPQDSITSDQMRQRLRSSSLRPDRD